MIIFIKQMKFFKIFLVILTFFLLAKSQPVLAKKSLPKQTSAGATGNGVIISPKLRSDRLALIVNFSNLLTAKSVSYSLSYNSQGVAQGVAGSIKPEASTTSRELLFGTCSSGVCRYHTNLTNVRFVVTIKSKSGNQFTKSYRVKP